MNNIPDNFARSGSAGRQSGVGIIEVLIALVVVSLGVLGMASLQLTGMKHSSSGYNRSMAVLFAENMASRMRAQTHKVLKIKSMLDCPLQILAAQLLRLRPFVRLQ